MFYFHFVVDAGFVPSQDTVEESAQFPIGAATALHPGRACALACYTKTTEQGRGFEDDQFLYVSYKTEQRRGKTGIRIFGSSPLLFYLFGQCYSQT